MMYEKRNGQFVLQITGHPKFGVPFGQDRIVPIFLATLAVQQKSQVIRFRSAGAMKKRERVRWRDSPGKSLSASGKSLSRHAGREVT